MKKGLILQDTVILNVYAPNNIATKYMKQKLLELKEEIKNPLFYLENSILLSW